jgi:hypothetical protein
VGIASIAVRVARITAVLRNVELASHFLQQERENTVLSTLDF